MEITRPRTCNGNYTPRDLYCTPWESCGCHYAIIYSSFPLADRPVGRSVQIEKMALYIYISPKQDTLMKSSKFFFDPMLFPNEILTLPEAP